MYDIIVVGAGPAGSSFAKFASEKGFSVAVIDSGSMSSLWSKPCGNGLVEETFKIVKMKPPSGKELLNKAKKTRTFFIEQGFHKDVKSAVYIIDRTAFGKRLMNDALKSGAEFFENTSFLDVIMSEEKVVGIKAKRKGKTIELKSRLVVDCTGISASVKSKLPREWPVSDTVKEKALCFRGFVELENVETPDLLKAYIDPKIAPNAYWWLFPSGNNLVNIGLGVLPQDKSHLIKNYRKILSKLPVVKTIQEAGAAIPMQRPPRSLVGPGFLVLGDAAPTINSMSGEGMGTTMEAAYLAASNLDSVAEGGWTYESAWAMNEYLWRIGPALGAVDVLKKFFWKSGQKTLNKSLSLLKNKLSWLKLIFSPKDIRLSLNMLKVHRHYKNYPRNPKGIEKWATQLDKFYLGF